MAAGRKGFDRLHRVLLAELNTAGELDWFRACADDSHIRAKGGASRHRPITGRPAEAGQQAQPPRRPDSMPGDSSYDSNSPHKELCDGRFLPVISRRGAPNIKGLGRLRYVAEHVFAPLGQFIHLAVRWEGPVAGLDVS
ncbi:hypothetical protein [Streptomyces sp. NPDC059224]|uniref:hypothetical protein n=1 Tax=Streptomyces sp. NPDC059224 TaxID=3346775 RepID=UPI0036763E7F